MTSDSSGDWPEHFLKMENGSYYNNCITCKKPYTGPKRSYVCWPCKEEGEKYWNSLTPEEQVIRSKEISKLIQEKLFKK